MPIGPDPFPTTRLAVPNLTNLLARLRGETRHCITIVHAKREGEGEWVMGTAAARLLRNKIKILGPETGTASDLVEHALRMEAKVVFAGELRRDDDARALRKAAACGIKPVGIVTVMRLAEAQLMVEAMGPWANFDVVLLSVDG